MVTKTKRYAVGLIVLILVMAPLGVANSLSSPGKDSLGLQAQLQTAALTNPTKVKTTSFVAKKITRAETQKKYKGSERGMFLTLLALVAVQQGSRR